MWGSNVTTSGGLLQPHFLRQLGILLLFWANLLLAQYLEMVKVEVGFKSERDSRLQETIKRSPSINSSPMHFSWHHLSPRLVLTSNSPDFDPISISHWKEEGFAVAYLPYDSDAKAYRNSLQHLADPLELGDKYAIVGTVFSLQRVEKTKLI